MNANQAFKRALAMGKKYTKESLLGGGAIVGKNVRISSIIPIEGGNRVAFSYTLDDGTERTSELDVMDGTDGADGRNGLPGVDGQDGAGIASIEKINSVGLVDTYRMAFTNGAYFDYEVKNGDRGIQGIPGPQGKDGIEGKQGIQGIQGERGRDGYPFLIYKEYSDISEFNAGDFPEIGLMFMINDKASSLRPVYRYAGDEAEPYSYVVSLSGDESIKGEPGVPGKDGEQGPPGQDGKDGATYTPKIGEVRTVPPSETASASVVVGVENLTATFNFSIPEGKEGKRGKTGDTGDPGADGITPHIGNNNNWFIGDVDTGVSANGIPGEPGEQGEPGAKGDPGRSVTAIRVEEGNNVVVTFSDGAEANIGRLDIDVSADFLTTPGFGNLRYYSGRFQYYDKALSAWIDAAATPENPILVKIAPQAMRSISGVYDRATGHNKLKWLEPEDTIIDGQVICVVENVSIVRKLGSEPNNISDGIPVIEVQRKDFGRYTGVWFVDEGFSPEYGDMWHYKAFPVSTTGFANFSTLNDTPVPCRESILYGFVIDQNESDPDSMITYIEDNAVFAPAHMDYENDVFDYGDWADAWFIKDLRPCMLNYDGTVAYELDPDDYTKKLDGTESDVANADFSGNAMVGVPKVYWKVVDNGDGTANVYFSNEKLDEDFVSWSHIDNNGDEIDYCYMPAYDGSLVNNRLRSLSGRAPLTNKNRQNEVDYAKANNIDSNIIWYTGVVCDWLLVALLLTLISKSTDSQTKFGTGNVKTYVNTSNTGIKPSGTLNKKGLFCGKQDQSTCVKVFGMENHWGNVWKVVAGWVNDKGTQKVKMTYGRSDGSTVDGYNMDGSGYVTVPNATPSGASGGYISNLAMMKFGLIPYASLGSATTYYCDGFWFNNGQYNYAITGGYTNSSLFCGAFCVGLHNTWSAMTWSLGASLSCKPLARGGDI